VVNPKIDPPFGDLYNPFMDMYGYLGDGLLIPLDYWVYHIYYSTLVPNCSPDPLVSSELL
jgi:hypothetical protein